MDQTKQQQGHTENRIPLSEVTERFQNDLNNGWKYYAVDGRRPLTSLRDISDTLEGAREVICAPPLQTLDKQ